MLASMLLPAPLLYTLSLLLTTTPQLSHAKPYPKEDGLDDAALLQNSTQFIQRRCDNPCGWSNQLCCADGQSCYTNAASQAQCGGYAATATDGGYWQYYTTTYVETDLVTYTSVYSTYMGSAVATTYAPTTTATCNYALNESPCGDICCASGQYCYTSGQCAAAGAGSSENSYYTQSTTGTAGASAPLRPTSGTVAVATTTIKPTTTVPFQTPVATGANATLTAASANNGGGLSGGAIAGIVIGVIIGLLLLLLLCLFCCFKAVFDSLLGIFGLGGKRKERRTEYIEEEYHHHHSGSGGAGSRRWYGDRPRPATVIEERRQKKTGGGWGGAAGVAAGLAGLGAVLGMKRKKDQKRAKTEYSGSSSDYTYEYTTTSSASSDERSRRYASRR